MVYKLAWKKEAESDFADLDKSVKIKAFRQLEKIIVSPELGKELGNKFNIDLTGYRKIYFNRKRYRIVYEIERISGLIIIWGIGKRDKLKIYKLIEKRKNKE